jgi:prefoldin subunit 5
MADLNRLKLKTNVLNRTIKDLNSYMKEVNQIKEKIETMKQNNVDEADVNKRKECLAETVQMVPEGKTRLEKAVSELQAQLVFFFIFLFFFLCYFFIFVFLLLLIFSSSKLFLHQILHQ